MPFNAQFHRQNTRKVSARKGNNYIVDQPSEDCQRIDNSFGWKEGRKPNSGATGSSTLTPRSRVEGIFNIDQDSLFPTSRFCAIARDTTSKHPRSSARRMATRHISLLYRAHTYSRLDVERNTFGNVRFDRVRRRDSHSFCCEIPFVFPIPYGKIWKIVLHRVPTGTHEARITHADGNGGGGGGGRRL